MELNENKIGDSSLSDESKRVPRWFGSLGWRILLWMTVVGMGPLAIMALQGYHCAMQGVIQSQKDQLRATLGSHKVRLESWIEERKDDLDLLVGMERLRVYCSKGEANNEEDHAEILDLLKRVRENSPSFETIQIYSADWLRLGSANDSEHVFTDSKFRSALATEQGFAIYQVHPHGDNLKGFHIGHALRIPGNEIVGFLVANLELGKTLDEILNDRLGLGETGRIQLFTHDGRYLRGSFLSGDAASRVGAAPVDLLEAKSSDILMYENSEGKSVLGTSMPLPELGWVALAEIEKDEAFAWLAILRFRAITTGSIVALLLLLVASKSSDRLSRPFRRLAEVARQIAGGRHDERVGILKEPEAREVAAAFNTMLDELDASHRKLIQTASLAAIGELSSSIVHEMRNPLSSVKINLGALRQKVEGDAAHSELADIASQQIARLEIMLSELLDFGKPLNLNFTQVRFTEIVRDVLEVVRLESQEKTIAIEIDDRLGDATINVDQEMMCRVLTNLVTNAIQASPEGAKVVLQAQRAKTSSPMAALSVLDNGSGIPKSQEDSLFALFYTTRKEGTGVGLANVKKIVDHHGGRVTAENRPEGGAIFTVFLPMKGIMT